MSWKFGSKKDLGERGRLRGVEVLSRLKDTMGSTAELAVQWDNYRVL
jgi:hypothetical protein